MCIADVLTFTWTHTEHSTTQPEIKKLAKAHSTVCIWLFSWIKIKGRNSKAISVFPLYINCLLTFNSQEYNLRSSRYIQLHVPSIKTELGKTTFTHSAPVAWNEIQKSFKLTALISLTEFKSYLNQIFRIVQIVLLLFLNVF